MYNFQPIPLYYEPSTTLANKIEIFENVWTDCDVLIDKTEGEISDPNNGIHWNRATTIGQGTRQDKRTNMDLGVTYCANEMRNRFFAYLHNRCNDTIASAVWSYNERHNCEQEFYSTGYNLLKYSSGQQYKAHFDGHTATGRYLSAILYLNDDYEGGELEFPDYKVMIKPEPGMLILFPSSFAYRHIAHPIKSGTKYAMVTWLTDRPV